MFQMLAVIAGSAGWLCIGIGIGLLIGERQHRCKHDVGWTDTGFPFLDGRVHKCNGCELEVTFFKPVQ